MNNNDILGTQNYKQSQADPFLAPKKKQLLANIYMWIMWMRFSSASAYSRIIRMDRIFRIRMANPIWNCIFVGNTCLSSHTSLAEFGALCV